MRGRFFIAEPCRETPQNRGRYSAAYQCNAIADGVCRNLGERSWLGTKLTSAGALVLLFSVIGEEIALYVSVVLRTMSIVIAFDSP